MDEVFNKMESGEAAIAPYYAGDYFIMRRANENLGFYYPENTNIFVDAMCIPKKGAEIQRLQRCLSISCCPRKLP